MTCNRCSSCAHRTPEVNVSLICDSLFKTRNIYYYFFHVLFSYFILVPPPFFFFFFFNYPAPTEISPLSLHAPLPILDFWFLNRAICPRVPPPVLAFA